MRNIGDYGGDPDFIALTGGSAGGHLCALTALTANQPVLQPGFESADTEVQAAVPYYGVYDLTRVDNMHTMMLPFLERDRLQVPVRRRSRAFRIGLTDLPRQEVCTTIFRTSR